MSAGCDRLLCNEQTERLQPAALYCTAARLPHLVPAGVGHVALVEGQVRVCCSGHSGLVQPAGRRTHACVALQAARAAPWLGKVLTAAMEALLALRG